MKLILETVTLILNLIAMFLAMVGIFAIYAALEFEPSVVADMLTVAKCEMNLGCPLEYRAERLINSLLN